MSNYPGTMFNIIDNSVIPELPVAIDSTATFMYAITADKGPERLMMIRNSGYEKLYGIPLFSKHGQPALQAATTLRSGGNILVKRLVSEDATLANVCVVAKIKEGAGAPKLDKDGNPLYLHEGVEVPVKEGENVPDGATPVMTKVAEIKYETITVEDQQDAQSILTVLEGTEANEGGFKLFPLFTILDNGRGVSLKKFRMVPDYNIARTTDGDTVYRLSVLEETTIEQFVFSLDPNKMRYGDGFSMDAIINRQSLQIASAMSEDGIYGLAEEIEKITGLKDVIKMDMLFGKDSLSKNIPEIKILEDSVNLSDSFGLPLESGTNGALGDTPIKQKAELAKLQAAFFSGELDDNIYDKERFPIHAIIDANYDNSVKDKIEEFVEWRQDVFFFADMGTDKVSIKQFEQRMGQVAKIREAAHYGISYDIIDDYTNKQIKVTIGDALAKILPNHLRYNLNTPLAGERYARIRDAVEGTINFVPVHTPRINEKEILNDMRCNYASYLGPNEDSLAIQTLYTANDRHTQLSYINNVLLTQDLIRAIIKRAPASRYNFIDGEDLEQYQTEIENVIKRYENKFKSIEFRYMADTVMEQNKIYYASIFVTYKDFAQQERFDIHAINVNTNNSQATGL